MSWRLSVFFSRLSLGEGERSAGGGDGANGDLLCKYAADMLPPTPNPSSYENWLLSRALNKVRKWNALWCSLVILKWEVNSITPWMLDFWNSAEYGASLLFPRTPLTPGSRCRQWPRHLGRLLKLCIFSFVKVTSGLGARPWATSQSDKSICKYRQAGCFGCNGSPTHWEPYPSGG